MAHSPMANNGTARRLAHLRNAKDLMDASFAGPLDLDRVAAEAGYSRYHFARTFQEVYGESPGRYLARRRVERAQDLLRGSDLTVTEICLAVGFESLGTFSAAFKRATGRSPSAYRREVRDDPATPLVPGCVLLMRATPPLPPGPRGKSKMREDEGTQAP